MISQSIFVELDVSVELVYVESYCLVHVGDCVKLFDDFVHTL